MSQELTGPHAPYMLIVYALVERIKSGELKPGDRVPSVTELVGTYNVSHSTARRALAKLKEMGITDTVPGYATFVRFPDQGVPKLQKLNGRGLCLLDHSRRACVIRVAGGSTPGV